MHAAHRIAAAILAGHRVVVVTAGPTLNQPVLTIPSGNGETGVAERHDLGRDHERLRLAHHGLAAGQAEGVVNEHVQRSDREDSPPRGPQVILHADLIAPPDVARESWLQRRQLTDRGGPRMPRQLVTPQRPREP